MMKLRPIDPERLRTRLKFFGFTQASLATAVGVDQSSISDLLRGRSQGSKHLPNIAKILGTTPDWLTGLVEDPSENALALPTTNEIQEKYDLVKIRKIKNGFGMGETFLDLPELSEEILISRTWLGLFTAAAANDVVIVQGIGNSMEPTISNGDWLICNKSATKIASIDDIWVFTHHGMGGIKRIRKDEEGRIVLMSDNQNVENQIASESALHILARVDAIVKKI